ncbi:MAG: DUF5627 domain-containing protein [Phocaeicola sp.]
MKKILLLSLAIGLFTSSCKNAGWEFEDYGTTTVYFAQQSPVRTITLGEDMYDTTLDNEHKCKIYATMGGVYENKTDRVIDVQVDNTLCDRLTYGTGEAILPLPSSHYTLASNQITIPSGTVLGGVEVQFTDAFFQDPSAIKVSYVIPLVMTGVRNADQVLSGTAQEGVTNPNRFNNSDWSVKPKDYTLYAVKYKNKWHGNWLSRGVDVITENGTTTTQVRHKEYIEYDEVRKLATAAFKQVSYPLSTTVQTYNANNELVPMTLTCNLLLTFDEANNCTISTDSDNVTVSGSGAWKEKSEKKAWGDKDRDGLYLDYNIDYRYQQTQGGAFLNKSYACKDTLVARDRESKLETFTPVYN